jgi:hypothetical protein
MHIAIIGSGNVGTALALGLHKAGHNVVFGVRDPQSGKARKAAEEMSDLPLLSIEEAAAQNEILVITTPPQAVHDLIPQLGDVENKIIIDSTNAVRTRPDGYPTVYHALQAETACKHLVKCFNSTGFENMKNPVYRLASPILHDEHIDMFMAGDSHHAKQICTELAKQIGFHDCYDFGGSDKVELLEQFALSWINLAIMQGMGRDIAFKLIRRTGH